MVISHPLSASSIYYDPRHPSCSIYVPDSLFPQSLSNFSWSGTLNFILHTFFNQSLSSFRNICPYHHNLFCCITEIMSSNPSLSLNRLLGTLSCSLISLPAEVPLQFPFLRARSHFHATYYIAHNCTISLSLSMVPTVWIYSIQFEFWSPHPDSRLVAKVLWPNLSETKQLLVCSQRSINQHQLFQLMCPNHSAAMLNSLTCRYNSSSTANG